MKRTLEQSITTEARPEDLKVIEVIISKMTLFEGYYGEFTRLHVELQYKEFSTLSDDFKGFYRQIVINAGKFSISELASLKRSFVMLRDRNIIINELSNIWYMNFLNESIFTLEKWLNEILEQITEAER